jgi:predicted O-linked N-acetylglucosamine transferase (SPINDLY family)
MKRFSLAQRMCDWDSLDERRRKIREIIANKEQGILAPFLALSVTGITSSEQRECSELWMEQRSAASALQKSALAFTFALKPKPRIRLGYLSCDFHEHATALLLVEMFEAHDRERFEVYAYSYGLDDGTGMRERLERTFDRFVDIQALSTTEAASAIHQDEIDILIDLKGYTSATRTVILTLRPAPVQVNYLGYPGTLGGEFCDYIVTDRYLTPPETASDYSEVFAYLPHTYQPHGRKSSIGARPTRQEAELPEEGFIFCCFTQPYKITPEIFDIWCRLLVDVPGSVLWLLQDSYAEGNLRREAFHRGITAEQIVFAEHKPQIEHLGRLQLADLVLDTLPYNGHTTASDALWVGVPIMTCAGDTFPSRVAGSVLRAIGLDELISGDLEEYYQMAFTLATCSSGLQRIKEKLAFNRLKSPLFDVRAYTRDLEELYEAMWENHLKGDGPGTVSVVQDSGA